MAVYRSDQAQFTFGVEAAQGGDPELMEGTIARSPTPTLGAAANAGSRTITLSAEFTALKTSFNAAVLAYGDTIDNATDDSFSVDNSSGNNPEVSVGMVLKVNSEYMKVTAVSGTNNRDLTVTRGFEGTTAQSDVTDNTAIHARFIPGDFIRIGTLDASDAADTVVSHEIRRVESTSGTTVTLDRPLGFYHASGQEVRCVSAVGGHATRNDKNKYITWIPGVYETIDTPDPQMSIEGRRFLSTQSKRNWSVAYAGAQALAGGVSGITLLNGWPLRFPIGKVTTRPSNISATNYTLDGAVKKGDVFITLTAGHSAIAGDTLVIYGAASISSDEALAAVEVRKIDTVYSTNTFKLNYPLSFDHADDCHGREPSRPDYYDHQIIETVDLDTVSWHVHMQESSETTAKNFDRRYVGGMIGSMTLSADEGGMLMCSWDSVNFLNMIHNQANQTTVGTNDYQGASVSANMPRYGLMQAIDTNDVCTPRQTHNTLNSGSGYPTTSPYYFSEGSVKFFGQEFARVRGFNLSISNSEEPRYYLGKQGARARGPYEIKEGPRDYSMGVTVALPDADLNADVAHASASQDSALELFRQLLLEGDYGGTTAATSRAGFTMTLKFERADNDYIIIDIPSSTTAGSPTAGSNAVNSQGIFINTAPHPIGGDNPYQVNLDLTFRSLNIYIRDQEPFYP